MPLLLSILLPALGLEHQDLLALGLSLDDAADGGAGDVGRPGHHGRIGLHQEDAVERDLRSGLAVHTVDDHNHPRLHFFLPAAGLYYREHGGHLELTRLPQRARIGPRRWALVTSAQCPE